MGFASWYDEHIVPRFIKCACSSPAIMKLRDEVVPLASGAVFEIGCGGGINQALYDPAKVTSHAGMDPFGQPAFFRWMKETAMDSA